MTAPAEDPDDRRWWLVPALVNAVVIVLVGVGAFFLLDVQSITGPGRGDRPNGTDAVSAQAAAEALAAIVRVVSVGDGCQRLVYAVDESTMPKADLLVVATAFAATQPASGFELRQLLCPTNAGANAAASGDPSAASTSDRAISACGTDMPFRTPLATDESVAVGLVAGRPQGGELRIVARSGIAYQQLPGDVAICGSVLGYWTGDEPFLVDSFAVGTEWRVDGVSLSVSVPDSSAAGQPTPLHGRTSWVLDCGQATLCGGEFVDVSFSGRFAASVLQATGVSIQIDNLGSSHGWTAEADL
jgi:hypothetical protein